MICPNCKKEIANNSSFCTECGFSIASRNDEMSVNNDIPAKKRGVSKKQFIKNEAPESIKKISKLCMILFGVLTVLILISSITFNNTSIYDLPLMKMFMTDADREMVIDQSEDLKESFEEFEEVYQDNKHELTKKNQKILEKFIKSAKKLAKKQSVSNMIYALDQMGKLENMEDNLDDFDLEDITDDASDLEEVVSVFKIARTVAYIFGVIVVLLMLLAAYFKRTGVVVLGTILYVPICLLIINVALGILIFAAAIALAVCTSKINKAWKKGV